MVVTGAALGGRLRPLDCAAAACTATSTAIAAAKTRLGTATLSDSNCKVLYADLSAFLFILGRTITAQSNPFEAESRLKRGESWAHLLIVPPSL